jgi:hypothetical protein
MDEKSRKNNWRDWRLYREIRNENPEEIQSHPKEIKRFGKGTTTSGEILEDMGRSFVPKNFQC